MAARSTKTQLEQLREPFAPEAVKQRQGSGGKQLDYVAIETVLARLLDAAPDYSWVARIARLEPTVISTRNGDVNGWTAFVEGQLSIGEKTAAGVGAMVNADPDMAVKSANSEAMKNAAKNGFGVALELWDEEYRKGLDRRRKLAKGSAATLKQAVFGLAVEQLGKAKPSAKEIAAHFGVQPGDLADEETLKTILTKEGLL